MKTTHEPRIVVGVSPGGCPAAVDQAAAEARLRGLPLELLSACPSHDHAGPHTALTAVLHRVCATWPELAVTAHNVTGRPADALIAASRTAAMVVVGRDTHPPDELVTRSVGAQVAAHAYSPTLVVPPETAVATDTKVLLGVGLTPDDEPAIAYAFEEAALRGVPLVAAHVWAGMPSAALAEVSPFAYDLRQAQGAADRMLAEALAGWADKYPDLLVERMPLYDANPALTLLDVSHLAGLVVVGARRHGRRSSHLLGTVTRALIRRARCPVAVVRTTD